MPYNCFWFIVLLSFYLNKSNSNSPDADIVVENILRYPLDMFFYYNLLDHLSLRTFLRCFMEIFLASIPELRAIGSLHDFHIEQLILPMNFAKKL